MKSWKKNLKLEKHCPTFYSHLPGVSKLWKFHTVYAIPLNCSR